MNAHSTEALEEARKIILKGLKEYRVQVFLFGSHAKSKAGRTSDIDVAVWPSEPLPQGVLSTIRQELEESNIPYSVDLVDVSQLSPKWAENIKRDWVPWTD